MSPRCLPDTGPRHLDNWKLKGAGGNTYAPCYQCPQVDVAPLLRNRATMSLLHGMHSLLIIMEHDAIVDSKLAGSLFDRCKASLCSMFGLYGKESAGSIGLGCRTFDDGANFEDLGLLGSRFSRRSRATRDEQMTGRPSGSDHFHVWRSIAGRRPDSNGNGGSYVGQDRQPCTCVTCSQTRHGKREAGGSGDHVTMI